MCMYLKYDSRDKIKLDVFREADKNVATLLSSRKDGRAYHRHKARGERRQKEYYLARVFSYSMQNR